jgi:carbonic anhydrase
MAKSATAALDDEQAGLTSTECCFECTAERCAISHLNVCSHPNKGGMQAVVMNDPEALKRYQRARKTLAVQVASKRG